MLQGELLMSEANFLKLFPEQEGYRFLLVDAPADRADAVSPPSKTGCRISAPTPWPPAERLAEFHRVENTYLSTFQTLGGLGLLLGTIGLAAVLLRNVLERRRELALLGAVGYGGGTSSRSWSPRARCCWPGGWRPVACALVAIAPVAVERGGALPTGSGAGCCCLRSSAPAWSRRSWRRGGDPRASS